MEDNDRLYETCRSLGSERDELKEKNKELKQTVATLEKKIAVLELGETLVGRSNVNEKQAKARINRLMREIDRCIALMNK